MLRRRGVLLDLIIEGVLEHRRAILSFYQFRFPLEMHMVHINCKYYDADGNLDDAYASTEDGVAVLGFLFDVCYANEVGYISAMMT